MVANVKKSSLAARLGAEGTKAWEKHKDVAPPVDGGATLPPGIEDGVACVRECAIADYGKGDLKGRPYLMMTAIVISPETFTDETGVVHTIAGRRISKGPIPMCQSKDWEGKVISFDANYCKIMETMKLIGVGVKNPEVLHPDALEDTCAAIVEAGKTDDAIHISFRTWKGKPSEEYKNPKVQVVWQGVATLSANGQPAAGAAGVNDQGTSTESTGTTETTTTTEVSSEEVVDLDALLAACKVGTDDDEETRTARVKMRDLALASGVTEQEIEDAEDWDAVFALLQSKSEVEEWIPSVGNVVRYKPIDGKTGKPKARAVNVEIKKVNAEKATCDCLNMTDKKTLYSGVAWTALEHD